MLKINNKKLTQITRTKNRFYKFNSNFKLI